VAEALVIAHVAVESSDIGQELSVLFTCNSCGQSSFFNLVKVLFLKESLENKEKRRSLIT